MSGPAPKTDRPMREQVASFDWASTPLGPPESWRPELCMVVEQVLDSGFPKAVAWGPSLITIYNDAFRPILGNKPDALGRPFSEIWAEAWDVIGPIADKAMAGEATFIENFPIALDRDGAMKDAWFTFCYSPLKLDDGSVGGMLDTVVETTETVRTQGNLVAANQELAHRLRNTLGIVQAIASQTLRDIDAPTLDAFRQRISSLANAHDVLLRQNWAAGSLRQTVIESLAPTLDQTRVDIGGPDLQIGSRTTVALSMMLHELATNAVKYGAMSVPGGRIDIGWTVEDGTLRLRWRETGGPPVAQPSRKGFGSRLIERGLGSGSTTTLSFQPEGLVFELTAPVGDVAG